MAKLVLGGQRSNFRTKYSVGHSQLKPQAYPQEGWQSRGRPLSIANPPGKQADLTRSFTLGMHPGKALPLKNGTVTRKSAEKAKTGHPQVAGRQILALAACLCQNSLEGSSSSGTLAF